MPLVRVEETLVVSIGSEAAMGYDGIVDWVVIGSGYLLALGLFAWLGGIERAGEAIKHWGRSASTTPREGG